MRALVIALLAVACAWVIGTTLLEADHRRAVEKDAAALTGGDPARGKKLVRQFGCVACHAVPGLAGTKTFVGPPLEGVASRMYIAGVLENKPDNLEQFLRNPRAVVPNGAMPNLGLRDADVRDLAAFLYTLR
jgi:cytochrome c